MSDIMDATISIQSGEMNVYDDGLKLATLLNDFNITLTPSHYIAIEAMGQTVIVESIRMVD